jgi:hypothetical protein
MKAGPESRKVSRYVAFDSQFTCGVDRVFVLFGGLANTLAKTSNPLSAEESDPNQLGWMTGFPPPSEKLIMQPESDFSAFPSCVGRYATFGN